MLAATKINQFYGGSHTLWDVDLEVRIEPGLPVILADHDALVDAVVNLLSNAYKYGGEPRRIGVRATASV